MTNNTTAHQDALRLVHEEAGRTLSKSDFDLCMRIAKRALLTSPRAAAALRRTIEEVRADEREHETFRSWQKAFHEEEGRPMEPVDAWQIRAMLDAAPAAPVAESEPIPMLLFCPRCGTQHIDAEEWADDPHDIEHGRMRVWSNPPHRSHLCHACGIVWRPADVATVGVEAIETSGKADTWTKETPWIGHNRPAAQAVAADGEAQDGLLQLDVLLANFHAAVWHAGAGDDGPIAFDMAGKDEAKAIQAHVRAMFNACAAQAVAADRAAPSTKGTHPGCEVCACPAGVCQSERAAVSPATASTDGERDALNEAIRWANDDGLPGTADHLRAIRDRAASAEAREPLVLWQDGTGMLWDTYSYGKWMHRFVSPHGWDAHAVAQHLYGKGYAGHLEVRAVWSGNYPAPADAGEAVAPDPIAGLIARHAEELERNDYAYFELAYTRQTGWMAWITDKPFQGPVLNPDRKVLARGQGGTPAEACRDALDAAQGAQGGKGGDRG